MKKTFQKTLIAAAAGVALMSAVGTASANSLLFPYFTTATGAQSVLSLYSPVDLSAATGVHYVYNYGSSCTHFDAYGKLTANDILTHSIAATTAGGFGKAVAGDTSTPVYFPLANQTGFLVVSTRTAASNTAATALQGAMAIVDPSSGLVVSYQGVNNGLDTTNAANEGNFAAITDTSFALASLPTSLVTTSWYGVVAGDMSTVIGAGGNWGGVYTASSNGNVYNNDEVAYSGTKTKAITCAGSITAADLMTDAQAASVSATGSLIKVTGAGSATGTGAILMKMQSVQAAAGAPFAGKQFLHREIATN